MSSISDPDEAGKDVSGTRQSAESDLLALARHIAPDAMGLRCELTADKGTEDPADDGPDQGRCPGEAAAIRWECGFKDDVCEHHARTAAARGAVVLWPSTPADQPTPAERPTGRDA